MNPSLGNYLREVRKKLNLSLRDVQAKIGISNAYLSQIETDKSSNPSPKILHKIAGCYNISYEYLMKLAGYPVLSEEIKTAPLYRLQNDLEELSTDEKKEVLDYIEFLKSKRKEI